MSTAEARLDIPVVLPAARARRSTLSASRWGRFVLLCLLATTVAGLQLGFIWWLGVLTALGFAAAFVGLVRPALGLIGISLLCTLDPVMRHFLLDAGVAYLRFNTLNYWLLIVMLGHNALLRRFGDPQTKLFAAFIALLLVELALSERVSRGTQHILGLFTIFGIIIYFVRAAPSDRGWFWQGVIGGSASALGGLLYNLQYASIPPLNHNVYALFPETGLFALCLAFGFAREVREEFALVGLAAVNVVWVFLSGSRGGLIIALVALAFMLVSMRGAGKRLVYVACGVGFAVLVSGWFAERESASIGRFEKLWSADETADARTSGRSSLALGGWFIFLQHPLGVGTGGSELAWAKLGYVAGVSGLKAGEEFSLHSGWIKVLAENGLPGVILFAACVASFGVVGWRSGDRFRRALGIAVTATLAVAFLSTEFQGKGFWFLSAGAITILNRRPMLAALSGGTGRSVWWIRPAMPIDAVRPRAVGQSVADAVRRPTPRRPRPLV